MFGRTKQEKDEGVDTLFLQDLYGQQLAIFDYIATLTLEVERVHQVARENNALLKELVALGWNHNGGRKVPQAEGGDPGPAHGKDNQGASEGQVRVPVVGRHGVEEVS